MRPSPSAREKITAAGGSATALKAPADPRKQKHRKARPAAAEEAAAEADAEAPAEEG